MEGGKKLLTPVDFWVETQKLVNAHTKLALDMYKEWKTRYGLPTTMAANFMKGWTPKEFHSVIDFTNSWVEKQTEITEEFVEKNITTVASSGETFATPLVPTFEEVQKIVNEQMKLSFRQYKELRKKYGTPMTATNEFLKTVFPVGGAELIDAVNKWVDWQVDLIESYTERGLESWLTPSPSEESKPVVKKKK